MSSFSALMASIGDGDGAASSPSSKVNTTATAVPIRSAVPDVVRPQLSSSAQSLKRKADNASAAVQNKAPRLNVNTSLAPPSSRSATSSPGPRSSVQPARQQTASATIKSKTASPIPATTPKLGSAAPTAASSKPAGPPKKGYLATLERAKAAQEAAKQLGMGQIKHQKVAKLSRRERERLQAEAAASSKGKAAVGKVTGVVGRSRDGTPADGKAGVIKPERKPVEVGYKGTMRSGSSQPSYRGTMQSGKASAAARGGRPRPRDEYARWSDENEEDLEDEEDDVESESDMEAGMDEIDYEEMRSERVAKKEDEAAKREEEQLRKQKLERKRKLERLEAAAAKRKKVY